MFFLKVLVFVLCWDHVKNSLDAFIPKYDEEKFIYIICICYIYNIYIYIYNIYILGLDKNIKEAEPSPLENLGILACVIAVCSSTLVYDRVLTCLLVPKETRHSSTSAVTHHVQHAS